jgi:hypothetical protein
MVKSKRFLSILATAVILAMLIVAIPVTPALAAEKISVSPTSGTIDDYIEISCTGFSTEEDEVFFYFSGEDIDVGDDLSDLDAYEYIAYEYTEGDASFATDFDVPKKLTDGDETETVTSGDYYVYAAYDDDEIVAKDDFRVSVIEISISPDEGTVGTKVKITGSGFEEDEEIDITFGSTSVDIDSGDDKTDGDGEFSCYIIVPEAAEGEHTIKIDISGDDAEADFTVEPAMEIDPKEGAVNDRITATGTGFAKNEEITITFDGDEVATDETSSKGSFETTFYVPELGAGTYDIEAEDESNNSASATFKISTEVSISPTTTLNSPGYVGDEITISGTGFKANSDIEITYASTPVTYHTTSKSDGSFSYTFEVPPSEAGEHTITATDGVSSMSATFVMESTPPETPPPQRPYMESKADSQTYFDWDDVVTDIDGQPEKSTPITYDLQVATDENFTHKVVNKTGLTTSEYTLTEDEALESTSDETPYYYWRVRAVDAASNASQWTGTGTFKVGFSFKFPGLSGWGLYVLIGVGAVVLFFIGLWVGRRSGGDYY